MNKVLRFILTMVALAGLIFTTAFTHPVTHTLQEKPVCGLFMILKTVFTNNEPCGIGRADVAKLITSYFTEIFEDVSKVPVSTVSPLSTQTIIVTFTPTPVSFTFGSTNTNQEVRQVMERVVTRVIRTRIIPTRSHKENVSTPIPTNTKKPEPTNTLAPIATPEPINTIEIIPTDIPTELVPTQTNAPVESTPTTELVVEERETAAETPTP